jgi:hypothetical protein
MKNKAVCESDYFCICNHTQNHTYNTTSYYPSDFIKIDSKKVKGTTKNKIILLMHDQMFITESDKSKLYDLIVNLKGKYVFKFLSEY